MYIVASERKSPIRSMGASSKKCKKRGKRKSGNRVKRRVNRKIDYISDLPEHVLHHVLSYLHAKDAARTSILSTRWSEVWNSYQKVAFDLRHLHKMKSDSKKNYKNVIDGLLKYPEVGREQLYCIDKLKLCLAAGSGITESDLNDWISAAVERKVGELEVQVKSGISYLLPSCVICWSSITALNLYKCLLPDDSINLPRLQKLSFKLMDITPLMLQNFISGCPLIEDLRLIQCVGLKSLRIGNLERLRRVDLHMCHMLDKIVIETQCLETFWYYNNKKRLCNINLSACSALKELMLEYPRMTDKMFRDQMLEFPELEKLVISRCNGLKKIRLTGDKLRKLVIRRCRRLKEAHISAPNISSLEYRGKRMPFMFQTHPRLKEVMLTFEPSLRVASEWEVGGVDASRLYSFLEVIDHCKGLNLMSLNKLDIVIYEDVRAMFLPLRHISKPHGVQISARFQDLLDAALKTSPLPPTFSVVSHNSSEFPEIIYKELNKEKAEPDCCGRFKNKCWRHYLKNVFVKNWIFESSECSKASTSLEWQKTTFTFGWKTDRQGRKTQKAGKS